MRGMPDLDDIDEYNVNKEIKLKVKEIQEAGDISQVLLKS